MKWIIDNNKPIHPQLVEQLKSQIVSGKISPGAKLDSVRTLAQDAQVNPNTMQKALVELENQGLVYSKRTTGRFVTEDIDKIYKIKNEVALSYVTELKIKLLNLKYNYDEILELIKQNFKEE